MAPAATRAFPTLLVRKEGDHYRLGLIGWSDRMPDHTVREVSVAAKLTNTMSTAMRCNLCWYLERKRGDAR